MRDEELSPGDVCENYRIVSVIAAGGMGDVYEAVDQATGRTVAVKCLKVRHRNKEDARARMKMEAVVLAELQHANLVQVYDAGVTESGMVWIAMERLHGQTLRELMYRSGPLPVPDALHYACEIADGVDAVHIVNVIHRDLKPENVFVTTTNVVKVLDLGTGKFTGYGLNSTDRMKVIGTTAYMSPEQIKGLRVDARADVYALGLMVYEMLAGQHPLAAAGGGELPDELERIALMQLQMTPVPLTQLMAGLPSYVSTIVTRAIAKNRDDRYANMHEFSRELRGARKRFIAENRLEDAPAEVLAKIVGLREKLGAPPREGSRPSFGSGQSFAFARTEALTPVPARAPGISSDGLKTDLQTKPPAFTMSGGPPVPAPHEPTIELSQYSLPPGSFDGGRTDRMPPPDAIRMRTTNTNPLGLVSPQLTFEPMSVPEAARSHGSPKPRPHLRRALVTLGLGALIGVPPAVFGVMWTVHRQHAQVAEGLQAATELPRPEASGPLPLASAAVAAESAAAATAAPPRTAPGNDESKAETPPAVAQPEPGSSPAQPPPRHPIGAGPRRVSPARAAPTATDTLVAPDWGAITKAASEGAAGAKPGGRALPGPGL